MMSYNSSSGLYAPPTVLVYMFPEYFAERGSRGFRAPYSNVTVKYDSLYTALVSASMWYMFYRGVVDLRLTGYGDPSSSWVVVAKRGDVNPAEYGCLSKPLAEISVGSEVYLYDVITRTLGYSGVDPYQQLLNVVYQMDVRSLTFSAYEIERYRRHAAWLNQLLSYYCYSQPHIYRSVISNALSVAATARATVKSKKSKKARGYDDYGDYVDMSYDTDSGFDDGGDIDF